MPHVVTSAKSILKRQCYPPKSISDVPLSEWLQVDDILMIAKIDKETEGFPPTIARHYAGPYAYRYSGDLYRQYWRFLNKTDQEGKKILNESDIKRVARGFTKDWDPKKDVRILGDRQNFVDVVAASMPDEVLPHKKSHPIALPDLSNCIHHCPHCWRNWPRKDNRDTHQIKCAFKTNQERFHLWHPRDFNHLYETIKSAHNEGLTPEAICSLLKETRGLTAVPSTHGSSIKAWGLHRESNVGPYPLQGNAEKSGVTMSELLEELKQLRQQQQDINPSIAQH
jgi:hypothetical protein